MVGFKIENGYLDLGKTNFNCPYCKKKYNDSNDKYLNRCNKNKNSYTKINCECGKSFHMTYNYMGDAVSF